MAGAGFRVPRNCDGEILLCTASRSKDKLTPSGCRTNTSSHVVAKQIFQDQRLKHSDFPLTRT